MTSTGTSIDTAEGAAVASVVVPAYNEGRVIGRCLASLRASGVGPLDIVVAANGCSDDTVEVARRHEGVRVVEVPTPSKAAALNAGDEAARAFPRLFLDADIVLGPGALAALVEALSTPSPRVGSPRVRFVTEGSTLPVRLFYDAYRELPYARTGLTGLGVYGLSEAGRARFGRFPQVQADDLYVQRLFAPDERLTVEGYFDVQAPRDLANLVRVRTRVASGNAALAEFADSASTPEGPADFSASTGATLRALARAVRARPRLLPAAITYVGVVVAARVRARRTGTATWHRDDSTR